MIGDHHGEKPCLQPFEKSRFGAEEGAATVWFIGVISAIASIGLLLVALVMVWSAKSAAQAGADMSALSGADISSVAVFQPGASSGMACEQAAIAARENDVQLRQCWTEGSDTFVIVVKQVRFLTWDLPVQARARAGPRF